MKNKFLFIKKRNLLLIAGIFWLIAGVNVVKMAINAYFLSYKILSIHIFLSVLIFILFSIMFNKISKKHLVRIKSYNEQRVLFLKFFDLKSYILVIFMMSLGIFIRLKHILSYETIFFFYFGIGSALIFSGVLFFVMFLKNKF